MRWHYHWSPGALTWCTCHEVTLSLITRSTHLMHLSWGDIIIDHQEHSLDAPVMRWHYHWSPGALTWCTCHKVTLSLITRSTHLMHLSWGNIINDHREHSLDAPVIRWHYHWSPGALTWCTCHKVTLSLITRSTHLMHLSWGDIITDHQEHSLDAPVMRWHYHWSPGALTWCTCHEVTLSLITRNTHLMHLSWGDIITDHQEHSLDAPVMRWHYHWSPGALTWCTCHEVTLSLITRNTHLMHLSWGDIITDHWEHSLDAPVMRWHYHWSPWALTWCTCHKVTLSLITRSTHSMHLSWGDIITDHREHSLDAPVMRWHYHWSPGALTWCTCHEVSNSGRTLW